MIAAGRLVLTVGKVVFLVGMLMVFLVVWAPVAWLLKDDDVRECPRCPDPR